MRNILHEFSLGIDGAVVSPAAPNYRPPTWPPARDWPVVIDSQGLVVSRWGDPVWNLSPWAGKRTILNFGDGDAGKVERLDPENADLLRMVATWVIWGPRSAGATNTVVTQVTMVRRVIAVCSRNGISAATLTRFPRVLERLPENISRSVYASTITLLHRLYDARGALGFTIVDAEGLKNLVAAAPDRSIVQTPYIPPRIWAYQVNRLHECMTDFIAHKTQVEACFRFCIDAYIANFGSLSSAVSASREDKGSRHPFSSISARRRGRTYIGKFSETAERFGIAELLNKWVDGDRDNLSVTVFSTYLSLVTCAGLAYVANFTLQRKEEVAALRVSCLVLEQDEMLGTIPIICGETTKTDPDSDARWVASPSVKIAVEAMSVIAYLRMVCDRADPEVAPSPADQEDPYLASRSTEPWGSGSSQTKSYCIRRNINDLAGIMKRYPQLFDREQLRITPEDLKITRRLTPNLPENSFAVGLIWPLAWHQYRRTGAVNMFASGHVSDSTMQQQMKHSSRLMPIYYGRNHTRLHFNEEVQNAVVVAMYEAMAERVKDVICGDTYISPHSDVRKDALAVNILSAKDLKALIAMAKKGSVSFREHRLGGCMKGGVCEYGGIESVARCAGGDGGKPCADVLFDRTKGPQVRADLRRVRQEIEQLDNGQPRYNALIEERKAMENYLNVISAC